MEGETCGGAVRHANELAPMAPGPRPSGVMLFIQSPLRYYFDMAKRSQPVSGSRIYPNISGKERLAIWEKARGMWKKRAADPLQELKKMRASWVKKRSPLD
jgi:hypothetical protein